MSRFGFSFEKGGAHTARSMMLQEMQLLLSAVDSPNALKKDYQRAVIDDNCLGKRSGRNRAITWRHLVDLYSLDSSTAIFRALLYFWKREGKGQPLLGLLLAYSRDPILRMSAPYFLKLREGAVVRREILENYLDERSSGRFSRKTLKSTAQNLSATWTKSGHIEGKVKKIRSRAKSTPGSVSYALLLGYLGGARGEFLFKTEYARLLDCSMVRATELAEEASRRGWIVFKRLGNVMEVLFPNLLAAREMEWVREQN